MTRLNIFEKKTITCSSLHCITTIQLQVVQVVLVRVDEITMNQIGEYLSVPCTGQFAPPVHNEVFTYNVLPFIFDSLAQVRVNMSLYIIGPGVEYKTRIYKAA